MQIEYAVEQGIRQVVNRAFFTGQMILGLGEGLAQVSSRVEGHHTPDRGVGGCSGRLELGLPGSVGGQEAQVGSRRATHQNDAVRVNGKVLGVSFYPEDSLVDLSDHGG